LFRPDENYSSIESLLKIDSSEVRTIGIWGMGGIGKTTLAAAIFQKVSSKYEGSCFLENVSEESKRNGLSYTYNRLLSELLGEDLGIYTPKAIPSMAMRRLKCMKAFIVLDDVRTLELLENLIGVGHDCLGAGSRVIVTTRDKHVLTGGGIDKIHQVKEMNSQNSIRLFSLNAFKKILPNEGYEEISNNVVSYAKGNPLALKVLGSFLCTKSKKEWDSALNKLKEIPNAEIQKVLRLSYDELDDTEKNIFLDIACFFKGRGSSISVTKILNACGFFADIGLRNLSDKTLVTITSNNNIQMHDLIAEMGWEIVREESIKNPGERSRLWNAGEICDVLTNNNVRMIYTLTCIPKNMYCIYKTATYHEVLTLILIFIYQGTSAVESICLDMNQITCINLSSKAFTKMPNLRLLAFEDHNRDAKGINYVNLPGGLDFLPNNLRSFGWSAYPLNSLPSNFSPWNLVELHLPYSNLEKLWNGAQV